MNTDVRDESLGRSLDEAVVHLSPSDDRLGSVRRRGSVRRALRSIALVTAVVVSVSAVGFAALELSNRRAQPAASLKWSTWWDPDAGLRFLYPSSWHLTTFLSVCRIGFSGSMVSNASGVYRDPQGPSSCSWPPSMKALPASGVVVEVDHFVGGPVVPGHSGLPDTVFPLSMGRLHRFGSGQPEQRNLYPIVIGGDARYQVNVWLGRAASATDRALAARVVASIRPLVVSIPRTCPSHTGPYTASLSPTSGAPGTRVVVQAPVPTFTHDPRLGPPSVLVEVWWNTLHAESILTRSPSPILGSLTEPRLARKQVRGQGLCWMSIAFLVPNVPAGSYPVTIVYTPGDTRGTSGFAPYTLTFDVTG